MPETLLFISGQEIIILGLAVLLLFGSKKIPEMARGLGKGMREFRKAADDIKRELNDSAPEITEDLKEMGNNLKNSSDGIADDFKKFKKDLK
jgi:sec-independent protein translocase protein TatA